MPVIELGRRPDLLRVLLVAGGGFTTQIKLLDEAEQFDAPPELSFPLQATTWTAELADPKTAVFTVSSADVDLLIAQRGERNAILKYGETVWSTGKWETLDMGGRNSRADNSTFEIGVSRPEIEVNNLPQVSVIGNPKAGLWTGEGPPPENIAGAEVGDEYLDLTTGDLYELFPGV